MATVSSGEIPSEVRYVLGDRHYNAPNVRTEYEAEGRAWFGACNSMARTPQ